MSSIAIADHAFVPSYVPPFDRAVSSTAVALRAEFVPAGSTSWIEGRSERGEAAIREALFEAATRQVIVDQRIIEVARALMWVLPPHVPVPDVFVDDDGEVALDWTEASDRGLTITVRGNGDLGYSAIAGLSSSYGRTPFAGSLPDGVLQHLLRLHPFPTQSGLA